MITTSIWRKIPPLVFCEAQKAASQMISTIRLKSTLAPNLGPAKVIKMQKIKKISKTGRKIRLAMISSEIHLSKLF
ncbi:MAG: hypothetical protein EBU49_10595 [Proteobacteria bacterium]|nr:hypothetical protein [Pseudomonadota bacterium]